MSALEVLEEKLKDLSLVHKIAKEKWANTNSIHVDAIMNMIKGQIQGIQISIEAIKKMGDK